MDVGKGMMFSANVVDGIVHQLGGPSLAHELEGKMCREGQALLTSSGSSELATQYPYILHTVPPFYDLTDNGLLASCYRNALDQILIHSSSSSKEMILIPDSSSTTTTSSSIRVACPLLGAGCRGFPVEEAIEVAAKSLVAWMMQPPDGDEEERTNNTIPDIALAFAIPSGEIREQLIEGIERECVKYYE
jgi:O-acetyl-ADP-ribose deacetylase (regulator of RNase III)